MNFSYGSGYGNDQSGYNDGNGLFNNGPQPNHENFFEQNTQSVTVETQSVVHQTPYCPQTINNNQQLVSIQDSPMNFGVPSNNTVSSQSSNESVSLGDLFQMNISAEYSPNDKREDESLQSFPIFTAEEVDEVLNELDSDNSMTNGEAEKAYPHNQSVGNHFFLSTESRHNVAAPNFNENGSIVQQIQNLQYPSSNPQIKLNVTLQKYEAKSTSLNTCLFSSTKHLSKLPSQLTVDPGTVLNKQQLVSQNVAENNIHSTPSSNVQRYHSNLHSAISSNIHKEQLHRESENVQAGPSRVKASKKSLPKKQTKARSNPNKVETRGRKKIYGDDKNAAKRRHNKASKKSYHKCQSAAVKAVQRAALEEEVLSAEAEHTRLKTEIDGLYNRMMELSGSLSIGDKNCAREKLSIIQKSYPTDLKLAMVKEAFELE